MLSRVAVVSRARFRWGSAMKICPRCAQLTHNQKSAGRFGAALVRTRRRSSPPVLPLASQFRQRFPMSLSCAAVAVSAAAGLQHCRVSLVNQTSSAPCVHGRSFGCSDDQRFWVSRCRGTFRCSGHSVVPCGYPPGETSYNCSCADRTNWFYVDWERVAAYTMVGQSAAKMAYEGIQTLAAGGVEGEIVELGVWKGGMTMLLALAEERFRNKTLPRRHLWVYDTFEGLPEPGTHDDVAARNIYRALTKRQRTHDVERRKKKGWISADNKWNLGTMSEVMTNVGRTLVDMEAVHFVRGKVEQTLLDARNIPSRIAMLRLDTDWYASTRVELAILWPRLAVGGLMIIDDYDAWGGARKATMKFLRDENIPGANGVLLHDNAGFRVWKTR